jgi:hypothetical protein
MEQLRLRCLVFYVFAYTTKNIVFIIRVVWLVSDILQRVSGARLRMTLSQDA